MERDQLVEHLCRLQSAELVDVLRNVFAARLPWPEEAAFCRNKFFLGIASSDLESDAGEPTRWSPWTCEAVASPDHQRYGENPAPDLGLCQAGTCTACGVGARSNVKYGFCGVCESAVYMT